MKKQLGILLLALAVAVGFSGAASAQNYGYAAQQVNNPHANYAHSGMTYGTGTNPMMYMMCMYMMKLMYMMRMMMGYFPMGMMNMPKVPRTMGTVGTAPVTTIGNTVGAGAE